MTAYGTFRTTFFSLYLMGSHGNIGYGKFLVEAQYPDGSKQYQWMPIYQVQLHRYEHPNTAHGLTFVKK